MTPEKRREASSKGGKSAHEKGSAYEWTSAKARDAGRKGGIVTQKRRREVLAKPAAEVVESSDDGVTQPPA
ncbi:MAG TPA: KGG domain-containing protein [Patescibacteria group bacterium]